MQLQEAERLMRKVEIFPEHGWGVIPREGHNHALGHRA
jgi:hypothetical protein